MSTDSIDKSKAQGSIYYDATCPLCGNFVAGLKKQEVAYQYLDSNISKPPSVSNELPKREIIYVTKDGKILGNIDAIFQILDDAHRVRWLTWLGRTRILKPIFLIGYRIFAANRHMISKLVRACSTH
jgi:predicted DCC family thiol-disulfide oxidoreductase YuxK